MAFPTETVYGLGANALDEAAVRRIFAVKERPLSDPLIVHVAAPDDAKPLVDLGEGTPAAAAFAALAEAFWPAPNSSRRGGQDSISIGRSRVAATPRPRAG